MDTAESQTSGYLDSHSPLDGQKLGSVAVTDPGDVQRVVDEVASVQPFWAQRSISERAAYMRRAASAVLEDFEHLATLLTQEQGKPHNESYVMELLPTVDALNWIADNAEKILTDEKISYPQPFLWHKQSWFSYEPLGVVGVISPWNYPWSIPFGEVAIALVCGNGVVLKPASLTPLIGSEIQNVFEKAGLPRGLMRTVCGSGAVGDALVRSSTAKIFFTGSVDVGRQVAVTCAEQLKGCVLELGGKDPQLVLDDANLENAVAGSLWGGFANAGQTCSGIERVYVNKEISQAFIDRLVAGARNLTVGDPMNNETEIGPMVSRDQFELVKSLVDDAVKGGAQLLCGGPVAKDDNADAAFFAPAVLTGVTHDMRIMREEIFGPVIPVITVDSDEEAVGLSNDSEFGLGASVWTADRKRGAQIARRLNTGMVWVNDHMYSHGACQCSWGGTKQSGLGRAHSKFGFYECVNIKHIGSGPAWLGQFWWHPYDKSQAGAVTATARLLYGRRSEKLAALASGIAPLSKVAFRIAKNVLRR